jgi:hypothetical protein
MAGNLSVEGCGEVFQSNKASSNYGIGSDGRIALYVDECDRSWCTSSPSNDDRAITIEVANNGGGPLWPVSPEAYEALILLLTDVCQRNGITKLLWQANKSLIGQVTKQNMTVHRWFAQKACPGDYLYSHHFDIAKRVNANLEGDELDMTREELLSVSGTGDNPSDWAKEATEKMKELGIVKGDGKGNYGWQQPITRESMAVMLYKAFDKMGILS